MKNKPLLLGYIALGIVSVLWGTTYFALRIGVESFPPFLFSGLRQLAAGIILFLILLLMKKMPKIHMKDIVSQSIVGFLMIALGNGLIGWSERYIPSGLAAMIVSILPVYVVLLNICLSSQRSKIHGIVWIGLVLGCVGIVLIFRDNLKDILNADYLIGMLVCFAACLMWALGSIYAKNKSHTKDQPFYNAMLQMVFGGLSLLVMSVFLDDYNEMQHIEMDSIYAMIYLIVFGSLIAYSAFVYSLQVLSVEVAALYAYINPFIALLLGYYFLEESLTWMTFVALSFVLSGVYFINSGMSKKVVR